jgi:hypothetical protein
MADDDLAYGEYIPGSGHREGESDRGFLGDTYRAFTGRKPQQGQEQPVCIHHHDNGGVEIGGGNETEKQIANSWVAYSRM